MANTEIITSTLNPIKILIWNYWLRTEIDIRWPRRGWVELHNDDGGIVSVESSDPNDWYRPWLEKHAGKQGWDWDWRIGLSISYYLMVGNNYANTLLSIKFRDPEIATMFALRYS